MLDRDYSREVPKIKILTQPPFQQQNIMPRLPVQEGSAETLTPIMTSVITILHHNKHGQHGQHQHDIIYIYS